MPTWIEALKEWNQDKDKWCIPRTGTPDNAEVRAIMNRGQKKVKVKKADKKSKTLDKRNERLDLKIKMIKQNKQIFEKDKDDPDKTTDTYRTLGLKCNADKNGTKKYIKSALGRLEYYSDKDNYKTLKAKKTFFSDIMKEFDYALKNYPECINDNEFANMVEFLISMYGDKNRRNARYNLWKNTGVYSNIPNYEGGTIYDRIKSKKISELKTKGGTNNKTASIDYNALEVIIIKPLRYGGIWSIVYGESGRYHSAYFGDSKPSKKMILEKMKKLGIRSKKDIRFYIVKKLHGEDYKDREKFGANRQGLYYEKIYGTTTPKKAHNVGK